MTVRDLLGLAMPYGPIFFGFGGKDQQANVGDGVARSLPHREWFLLEHAGREDFRGRSARRVLLALAMQPEPELLLLDEPAAGIDVKGQEQFYDLIGFRLELASGQPPFFWYRTISTWFPG